MKSTVKMIEEYAHRGESYDVMRALKLLTVAYMEQCGLSLGNRTLVYIAAERWQEKLAWQDLALSEMARKEPFIHLMPHITADYDPDYYNRYDITGMDDKELESCCISAIDNKEFDEETLEVLCWGINDSLIHSDDTLSIEVETIAMDGTPLKGIIKKQNCAHTIVRMITPYQDISGIKMELVRNAEEILKAIYDEYNHIINSREQAELLYEEYKVRLNQCAKTGKAKTHLLFQEVFAPLLNENVIVSSKNILKETFGMEFYDIFYDKYPSWYIGGSKAQGGKVASSYPYQATEV